MQVCVCYSSRQRRVPWSPEGPRAGPTHGVCVFLKLLGPSPGPQGVGLPTDQDLGIVPVRKTSEGRDLGIVPWSLRAQGR